jgi:hypothetical protein
MPGGTMLLKPAFLKVSIMVQLAVHKVQRGKEMINEITVHTGSSKVLLPYDMLTHNCVSRNKQN